ncbi:DNA-directed RNA polymerase II core subunit rpb9 [Rhodotorula toruloides]
MADIQFCKECSNLLYPKVGSSLSLTANSHPAHRLAPPRSLTAFVTSQEDKIHHVLLYSCRNCPYQEETHNPCVYKHDLIVIANGHHESVFFGDQGRRAQTSMTLFYNCTNCHRTFQDPALLKRRKEQAAQQA